MQRAILQTRTAETGSQENRAIASGGTTTALLPAVSLDNITTFAALSGSFTTVPYVAELYNEQDAYDPSLSRFTALQTGTYEVCASHSPNATSPLAFELDLFVNGARENTIASGGTGIPQGCRTVNLLAGSYVTVAVSQASGAAVTFQHRPRRSLFPRMSCGIG